MGVQLQASSFFERLTAREQIHTFRSMCGVSRDPWSRLRPVEQR
jgi:ABC-2 type transport system ATP-binding protein